MIAIPNKLKGMLDYSNSERIPTLKDNATDEQKIIYADFIKEYLKDQNIDELFFKKHKH